MAENATTLARSVPYMTIPYLTRCILWTSLPDSVPALLREVLNRNVFRAALAASASNGSVTLHRFVAECDLVSCPPPMTVVLNRCDPGRGWRDAITPLVPVCPRRRGHRAWLDALKYFDLGQHWGAKLDRELQHFSKYHGIGLEITRIPNESGKSKFTVLHCGTDVLSRPTLLSVGLPFAAFPWDLKSVSVVVPKGVGAHRGSLLPESLPATLSLTVSAILVVAAGMFLLRDHGPLYAKPADVKPRLGALHWLQRPLLCSWLFLGVVLSTLYQGLLTSDALFSAPVGEIDSMEQLAASNLSILMTTSTIPTSLTAPLEEWGLIDKVRFVSATTVPDMYRYIGEVRNVATIVYDKPPTSSRLHVFPLGVSWLSTWHLVAKGSPLEAPLRKFLGRWRAAGLEDGAYVTAASGEAEQRLTTPEPIGLDQVLSTFGILLCGLASAALVLALEIMVSSKRADVFDSSQSRPSGFVRPEGFRAP